MPYVSNYVLNNWGNVHLQLLGRFRDIAVFVMESFFIAAPCGKPSGTQSQFNARICNNQYVIQTPLGECRPLTSDDTPHLTQSRPPLAGYISSIK